jgi:hypothetical protein
MIAPVDACSGGVDDWQDFRTIPFRRSTCTRIGLRGTGVRHRAMPHE